MTIQGNDERMIAYLLGELTEAETILIEEEYHGGRGSARCN